MGCVWMACAGTETYPAPGENPHVQAGTLEQDLARRDFTVCNGFVLQPDGSHQLLDPHRGQVHLLQRQLVFLHETSVADDPTRVFRGARYGARLGFAGTISVGLRNHIGPVALGVEARRRRDAGCPALGTRLAWNWSCCSNVNPGRRHSRCCSNGPHCLCLILPCNATSSPPTVGSGTVLSSALMSLWLLPVTQSVWLHVCSFLANSSRLDQLVDIRHWLADEVSQLPWMAGVLWIDPAPGAEALGT